MNNYQKNLEYLKNNQRVWLISGVAGFIGSNLLERLLKLNQIVVGIDNFSTGLKENLEEVKVNLGEKKWARFKFIEGDICDQNICIEALDGVDFVLHQAALGSVPRSIKDPINSNNANVTGFLNLLHASMQQNIASFTYASSSSVYGDHPGLPKIEEKIGEPLSPYAVTKYVNEIYARAYSRTYGFKSIGLRYFNVFGKRQNPNSTYAAVIPNWILSMIKNKSVYINGDGKTSRDFCHIENVIQANILSALAKDDSKNEVYNVAFGDQTTLDQLFKMISSEFKKNINIHIENPIYRDFREGDVRHSRADISKSSEKLGYKPSFNVIEGIAEAMPWYVNNFRE